MFYNNLFCLQLATAMDSQTNATSTKTYMRGQGTEDTA